ncbi:MAG: ComEA family DNA-binding protein [Oscillospiraceae bacterium]|nr:ComEA family DNA-binding protein [Oscillospiraceae bacterium]
MERGTRFDRAVLGLAAVFLLCAGGLLWRQSTPTGQWRVQTERQGSGEEVSSAIGADGRPVSLLPGEVMDVNTAPAKDLERLPGIGAGRAQAIVAYRQAYGGFQSVDELSNVSGIGPATLEGLRPYVTVGQEKTQGIS